MKPAFKFSLMNKDDRYLDWKYKCVHMLYKINYPKTDFFPHFKPGIYWVYGIIFYKLL